MGLRLCGTILSTWEQLVSMPGSTPDGARRAASILAAAVRTQLASRRLAADSLLALRDSSASTAGSKAPPITPEGPRLHAFRLISAEIDIWQAADAVVSELSQSARRPNVTRRK